MKQRTPGYIFIPLVLISIIAAIMMVTPVNFEKEVGFFGFFENTWKHFIGTFSNLISIGILFIAFVMLLIINAINKVVESQKFKKLTTEEQQQYLEVIKKGYLSNLFLSGKEKQTEEEEEAIIIDHGFDGIKELDNALPQWWLALFYGGVVYCVVYLLAFSFTDFAHPDIEYDINNEYAQAKVDEWIAANDIDISGAVNKYTDPQALEEGKKVFENLCATCHRADGGGGIGPNLTDDYWVNKTEDELFYNIYNIIYNGSPGNAQMRAFGAGDKKELTGLTIEKVASYVYYINQEKPQVTPSEGGAVPQGELVQEWARKK